MGKMLPRCWKVLMEYDRPPQDYWKVTADPQPNCINQTSSLLFAGVINTLTDFLVVLLPIRTVVSSSYPPFSHAQTNPLTLNPVLHKPPTPPNPGRLLPLYPRFPLLFRGYHSYLLYVSYNKGLGSGLAFLPCVGFCSRGAVCRNCTFAFQDSNFIFAIEVLTTKQITTSIPATKAFFVNYFPKLFPSLAHSSHGPLSSTPNVRDTKDQQVTVGSCISGNLDATQGGGFELSTIVSRSHGGTSSVISSGGRGVDRERDYDEDLRKNLKGIEQEERGERVWEGVGERGGKAW